MSTFFEMYRGVNPSRVQKEYAHALAPNETVEYACKTVRDMFIVTDRRILNVDKQGMTGNKKNYDSIPFNKVSRFQVEYGGKLAGLVTIRLWSSGNEAVEVVFHRSVNGEGIQKTLASKIC